MKLIALTYVLGAIVISVVKPNDIELLPKIVNVVENSSVTLTCSKKNGFLLETRWMNSQTTEVANLAFYNGQCVVTRFLLDSNLFDGICNGNGTYSVLLKKIDRKQHGAEWTCAETLNRISNIVSIYVSIPAVNVEIRSDESIYMRENQTQSVRCQTSACRPSPAVKWFLRCFKHDVTYDITENSTQSYILQEYGLMAAESILKLTSKRTVNNCHLFCEVWTQVEHADISSKDILVNVLYPPEGPPVIHGYKNGTVHQIVESESVSINCSVSGGNPLANLTLTCFNRQSTTVTITDTTVTSYLSWKAMRSQSECTCESNHIIGGKQITYLKFEVIFPPSEVNFTISGEGSEGGTVIANKGEEVTFICAADSGPNADIIIRDRSDIQITTLRNASIVHHTKFNVSCHDAGEYTCYARNMLTVGQGAKSKLILIVRCPPRPITVKDNNFTALLQSDVILQFIAHDFLDEENKTEFRWYKRNMSLQNGGRKHIILSYGLQLVLVIRNITQTDYGKYRVVVRNSVGQYMHYYELHKKDITDQKPVESEITGIIIGVAVGTFAFTIFVVVLSLIGYKYIRRSQSLGKRQATRNKTVSENHTTSTYNDINLASDPKTVYEQLGDEGRDGQAYMEMQNIKTEDTLRDYINMSV